MRQKQLLWAQVVFQGAKNEKLAFLRMEAPKKPLEEAFEVVVCGVLVNVSVVRLADGLWR